MSQSLTKTLGTLAVAFTFIAAIGSDADAQQRREGSGGQQTPSQAEAPVLNKTHGLSDAKKAKDIRKGCKYLRERFAPEYPGFGVLLNGSTHVPDYDSSYFQRSIYDACSFSEDQQKEIPHNKNMIKEFVSSTVGDACHTFEELARKTRQFNVLYFSDPKIKASHEYACKQGPVPDFNPAPVAEKSADIKTTPALLSTQDLIKKACTELTSGIAQHPGLNVLAKGSKKIPEYNAAPFGDSLRKACNISDEQWSAVPALAENKAIRDISGDVIGACTVLQNFVQTPGEGYRELFHNNQELDSAYHASCSNEHDHVPGEEHNDAPQEDNKPQAPRGGLFDNPRSGPRF